MLLNVCEAIVEGCVCVFVISMRRCIRRSGFFFKCVKSRACGRRYRKPVNHGRYLAYP
jgi:hypothetical protein